MFLSWQGVDVLVVFLVTVGEVVSGVTVILEVPDGATVSEVKSLVTKTMMIFH